jgi:hypothetical protein
MQEQHFLKPKQIRRIVEEVAAERRGSTLGYGQTELDAIPTDTSEDAHLRGTTLNAVILDEYQPKLEVPKVIQFKPEVDATQFFQDAAGAIETLNAASENFGQEYGQPNVRLIEARAEVDYLRNALAKAQQQLAEIEAEGDSTNRFKTAIEKAQTTLRGLYHRATGIVRNQLQLQKIGRILHHNKLPESIKDEIRLHIRNVDVLKGVSTFEYQDLPKDASKDVLNSRAAKVVEAIDLLAKNVDADQAQHSGK